MARPRKDSVMLSTAIDEFMKLQQAKRGAHSDQFSATVAADFNALSMFLRISGDKQTSSLTPDHFERYFYGKGGIRDEHVVLSRRTRTQLAPPVSDATHNQYRARIKGFIGWCATKGYVKASLPADVFDARFGVVRPLRVAKTQRNRPSPSVLLSLLDFAENARDRAYLATAMNTALRTSEIRALRIRDVGLDIGFIDVAILKTKDVDEQPITSDLDAELRRWYVTYAQDLGRPLRPTDYLFPRRRGGLISHYDTDDDGNAVMVRHPYFWVADQHVMETHLIVQKALKAAGLPTKKQGTHTIRHAVASAYFEHVSKEKGDVAALRETSALLHHQSVTTTELYLGMTPEKNRRNQRMKGQPFLSAIVGDRENVVPLRPVQEG